MYKIEFYSEIKDDLDKLSNEIASEVREYFYKYKTDPLKYSKPLHNQGELNLQGYRKTYVANATYRIVIKVENNIAKIVEVVAVGQRENKQVYKDAYKRVKNDWKTTTYKRYTKLTKLL